MPLLADQPLTSTDRWRTRRSWLPFVGLTLLTAWLSLDRLANEQLFLFRQPVDRLANIGEFQDARISAQRWMAPALGALAVMAVTVLAVVDASPVETARRLSRRLATFAAMHPALLAAFGVACLLDLASTWAYFQTYTLEDELHPAIRLVTYAYGITVGLVIAKAIQAGLVLLAAALFPRAAFTLLLVTTAGYAAAAWWNFRLL